MQGLYTDNSSTPLGQHLGLRNFYDFGLYSYCAYVNETHGICSRTATANKLRPYDAFLGDISLNYTAETNEFVPTVTFKDSQYLGEFSRGAYYLLLLGSIATALALFTLVHFRLLHHRWRVDNLFLQWPSQTRPCLSGVNYLRHRGQRAASYWCRHLDGNHQEGTEHQRLYSHAAQWCLCTRGDQCRCWRRALSCMGELCLHYCLHYTIHDQVCGILLMLNLQAWF